MLPHFTPVFTILKIDKGKSQTFKYRLDKPYPSLKHTDILNFVRNFASGSLEPYKVSEAHPKHMLNSTELIVPLNRENFLTWLSEHVKANKQDMVILFFSNEGCTFCERMWPIYEQVAMQQESGFNIKFGSLNMDFNELSYLETMGSLPVFYPVIRYFHGKT